MEPANTNPMESTKEVVRHLLSAVLPFAHANAVSHAVICENCSHITDIGTMELITLGHTMMVSIHVFICMCTTQHLQVDTDLPRRRADRMLKPV